FWIERLGFHPSYSLALFSRYVDTASAERYDSLTTNVKAVHYDHDSTTSTCKQGLFADVQWRRGLIAGFAAISLSFLLWQSPAAVTHNAPRAFTTVLAVVALGSLAAFLLRFSLSKS